MNKEVIYRLLINDKNVIVNGPGSTGKTLNVMFPIVDEILNNKESFIAIDSKEEYIAKYMPKLSKRGYTSIIINLRDFSKSSGWNPLEYPYFLYCRDDKDTALELIELIAKTIYKYSGEDKFWVNSARDLFVGVVLALFEDASPSEINLNSVNQAFLSANNKYKLSDYLTEFFNKRDKTSLPYIYASSTLLAPKDTKAGIFSIALQELRRFIASSSLSNLLSLTTYEIDEIYNKPVAIFLVYKPDRDITCEITSMYLEQILQVFNLCSNGKINVIVDNLNIINESLELDTLLSHDEDDKIKFYIGLRNINEIEDKYNVHIKDFANIVDVNENDIIVKIGSDIETFDNEYNHVIFIKNDDDYPTLRNKGINIFNIEYAVKDGSANTPEPIINIDDNIKDFNHKNETDEIFSGQIDDLISSIDKKISELEKEEKERKDKAVTEKIDTDDSTLESVLEANITGQIDSFEYNPFDEDSYLKDLNRKVKELEVGKYASDEEMDRIDALIKRIDERIIELEREEFDKKEKAKKNTSKDSKKISSDFNKFKVGVL